MRTFCLLPLLLFGMNLSATIQEKFSATQLPEQFMGYHVTDRLNYTDKNLFDYIDGGAELYLSYGLAGMTGCKYNGDSLPQITVEIYEMSDPKNAFGVYTQSRDKEESDYGQGSQSFPDFILFWKGPYFVIVNTQEIVPESGKAIRYLAKLIDESIQETGDIPAVVNLLPKEGLAPAGFLYFHHYIWLNSYFFIANQNIINIDDQTDAVLAKYGTSDARSYLLVVEYPDEAKALEAFKQLRDSYAPECTPENPFVQMEDKTWFTVWTKGNKLGAVFNGVSREKTEELYKSTINNM